MSTPDIRWQQRFENYKRALQQLNAAVKLSEEKELSQLEKQGLIQAFEYTHELAWKVMQDFFKYQGNSEIHGSRDATREAFKTGLIQDGDNWMVMIRNRNLTSHTYNVETSEEIYLNIINHFSVLFNDYKNKMQQIADKK